MEPLESRHLLSVTLAPIADQSVLAGAPLNLPLAGASAAGNPIDYTVEISNADLSADVPQGNPSLRLNVEGPGIDGAMVLELFEDLTPETVGQIVGLAGSGFYDGLTFHRVIDGFMIQGGDPEGDGTGGPGFRFDDEFHPALQFTGPGLLAMANSGPDTNGSQFFITAEPTRWLDFRHTIFGLLTEGEDVRQQINDVETDEFDQPVGDVVMTEVTVFHDDRNGVLRLSAPLGATGTAEVTVTATDSVTGEWASQAFEVNIGEDPSVPPPFLGPIDPIVTTVDVPVEFQIPGIDVRGNPMHFDGLVEPEHPDLALSVDHETGVATLTPTGGIVGVFSVLVGVTTDPPSQYDSQMVPVYIHPAAPAAVELLSEPDNGDAFEFLVAGVLPGAMVELLANGVVVGQATAEDSSVVIDTALADGTYEVAARQTLEDQAVEVGNLQTVVDLPSALSAPLAVVVDTTASVGGVKYLDLTGDGITDDDRPLGGFTIELYLDDGDGVFDPDVDVLYATALTDALTGEYLFSGLEDGLYFIREVVEDGWTQTYPIEDGYYTVEVVDGVVLPQGTFDFANHRELPALGGVKYHDLAGDGLTGDDVPLGGFTIELYLDDGDGIFDPNADVLYATAVTDPVTGEYTFTHLIDGLYFIREAPEPGWELTDPSDPPYYTVEVVDYTLEVTTGYDFANWRLPPTLSGVKFWDLTGDGLTDDDVPLGWFVIELYRDDGDGVFDPDADELLDTRVTDPATGQYAFDLGDFVDPATNSADGRYFLRAVAEPGWTQTHPSDPAYYTVDVVGHAVDALDGYDFASHLEPPTLSGVKYRDLTGDGLTPDDVPLGGFVIELYLDDGDGVFDPAVDTLLATQVTDPETGAYTFDLGDFTDAQTGLADGRYFIREVVPPGWTQTDPIAPLYYTVDVVNHWVDFTEGYHFANYVEPVTVSGVTYQDITGNGLTPDDVPLGGFTVELYLDDGDEVFDPSADELIATHVTDTATGRYTFTDLPNGRYFIRVLAVPDYTQTHPTDPLYYTVDVVNYVAEAGVGLDFAFHVELSSLAGFVYVDANNDGVKQPTESVIANAELWLSGVDTLGNVIGPVSTTTGVTGAYQFANLRPGTYTITQTQPPAFVDGKHTIGTPGGDASVPNVFSNIVLPAGFHGKDNNFGEFGLRPEFASSRVLIFPRLPDDVLDANTGQWVDAASGAPLPPGGNPQPSQIGVHRAGTFYLDHDGNGRWDGPEVDEVFRFGLPGDTPLVGDWNGDGQDRIGVWRSGVFYLDFDGDGRWNPAVDKALRFGNATDTPIIGDWNGDGRDQIGVWRDGVFYFDYSGDGTWNPAAGDYWTRFGLATDTPIIGDWNGNGQDQIGVWRNGVFYFDYSGDGRWNPAAGDYSTRFGNPTDTPVIGDFNGDGQDQIGVWRNGTFYLDYDGNGRWDGAEVDRFYRFGNGTDTPIIGAWAESPVSAAALHAASAPPAGHPAPAPLTLADLQPVVEEAMLYLPPELEGVSIYVQMVDLPGLMVAQASGNTIWIDPHAAGFGWFTDPSRAAFEPGEQPGHLVAHPDSEAALRIDLLTAVLHEMYHLAGHGHDDDGLMQPALEPGVRLLPPADLDPADAAALEAAWAVSPHEALAWLDELAAANRRRREEQSEQSLHVQAVDEALKLYWQ